MNTPHVESLSGRELHARFFQIVATLHRQGHTIPRMYVVNILERLRTGKERLSVYDRLPQVVDQNRVDVSYPAGSPFELWLEASHLNRQNPANSLTDQESKGFAFQAIDPNDPLEVSIINDEWRLWIANAKGLKYTSEFQERDVQEVYA